MMSTHEKLLPCPFCGGEAEIHDIGNDLKKSRKTEIVCTQCHVKKVVAAIHNPLSWTRATAIEEWNRRTPPAAVPDGWVMVPRNPTSKMLDAATPPASEWIGHPEEKPESIERWRQGHREDAERKYRSMISAAPAAPTEASDE